MSDFIPKPGELVVIQKGHSSWNNNGQMDKFVGKIHKFIGGTDEHNCFEKPTAGMSEWCWRATAGHFRKLTPSEEIRYYSTLSTLPKQGQRVILKEDDGWNSTMISTYKNVSAIVRSLNHGSFTAGASTTSDFGWSFKGYELDTETPAASSRPSEPKEGDRFDVVGNEGVLKKCEGGFYWHCIRKDNLVGFEKKGLRKKEFSKKILGYFDWNEEEDRILCRSIVELIRLLKALNDYTPGSDPSVEFETSWNGHEIEDKISINGQDCTIEKDCEGDYPYYISYEDSDEIFEPIETKLSINRYEFQERVLGYKDPGEYTSPQCASIRDLMTFVDAIRDHYSPKAGVGNKIAITGKYGVFTGEVRVDGEGYEWYHEDWVKDTIFRDWITDKRDFQNQILGYRDSSSSDFPYCHTCNDLLALCRAISLRNTTEIPKSSGTLHVGDIYVLTGLTGHIKESCGLFYWNHPQESNDTPFKTIGKNPIDFQQVVLGYKDGSIFPECKSLQDLHKFLKAIEACWNPTTLTQVGYSAKMEPTIMPNLGTSIIFINVPKI